MVPSFTLSYISRKVVSNSKGHKIGQESKTKDLGKKSKSSLDFQLYIKDTLGSVEKNES